MQSGDGTGITGYLQRTQLALRVGLLHAVQQGFH